MEGRTLALAQKHNQRHDEDQTEHRSAGQHEKVSIDIAHSLGIVDLTPVVRPVSTVTETEAQRRDLKRRYKKVFGYKPTEQDLVVLRRLVEAAEADRKLQ